MPVMAEILGDKVGNYLHSFRIEIPENHGKVIDLSDIILRLMISSVDSEDEGMLTVRGQLAAKMSVKTERQSWSDCWDDDKFSDYDEFADEEGDRWETTWSQKQSVASVETLRWSVDQELLIPVAANLDQADFAARVSKVDYQIKDNNLDFVVELNIYQGQEVSYSSGDEERDLEEECEMRDSKKKHKENKLKKVQEEKRDDAFPWLDEWLQGKDVFPLADHQDEQDQEQEERLVCMAETERAEPEVENQGKEDSKEKGILNIKWEDLYSDTPESTEVTTVTTNDKSNTKADTFWDAGEWVEPENANMIYHQEIGKVEKDNSQVDLRDTSLEPQESGFEWPQAYEFEFSEATEDPSATLEESTDEEQIFGQTNVEERLEVVPMQEIRDEAIDEATEEVKEEVKKEVTIKEETREQVIVEEAAVEEVTREEIAEEALEEVPKREVLREDVEEAFDEELFDEKPFDEEPRTKGQIEQLEEIEEIERLEQIEQVEQIELQEDQEAEECTQEQTDEPADSAKQLKDFQPQPSFWQKLNPFKSETKQKPKRTSKVSGATKDIKSEPSRPVEQINLSGLVSNRPLRQHIRPGELNSSSVPKHVTTSKVRLYLVKPGDTLEAVAERYGVSVDQIVRANNLQEPVISANEMIRIP